jgi:hypothetical protein
MNRSFAALIAAATICLPLAGCRMATEGEQENYARSNARLGLDNSWDSMAAKGDLWIDTVPSGARVEMLGQYGEWALIATTPMSAPLRIEATGRPYSLRISHPGYFSRTERIALTSGNSGQRLKIALERDPLAAHSEAADDDGDE